MKPYVLSIEVPKFIESDRRPRPLFARFETKKEWEEYKILESRTTINEFKKTRCAWSNIDREKAWFDLYHARKNFHDKYFKVHLKKGPKDVA